MNELNSFIPLLAVPIWHGFVVFLRVAPLVALLPAFGEQAVPARVKLAIASAFTLIIAPAVRGVPPLESFDLIILVCGTEVLAGLAVGLGLRLFILALQTAGAIAAQSTSLSQVLGGAAVDPLPAMGYILMIGGMTLAVISGLHVKVVEFVLLTYEAVPVGVFIGAAEIGAWGTSLVTRAFALAFTLAAPFVILSVLYNFALGAINKAMPQLMVAFVGAPVITLGGLVILMLSAPILLSVWSQELDSYLASPFRVVP